MPLSAFHPVVASWFRRCIGAPTPPQQQGWPLIARGEHTLIAAPTGSGKTLAAFLACLDRLFRLALVGPLPDQVEVLYVSPLKALSSDVRRNLEEPLRALAEEAAQQGLHLHPIRVGLRTGDTPAAERQAMARRPPQILVTTPESLYLCLTSPKQRAALQSVRTVIVDEIHALVQSKRGAHLAISLERLDDLCQRHGQGRPMRIGLSATQRPIEEVARFLVGSGQVVDGRPACHILDHGHLRQMDLAVLTPREELGAVCTTAQWADVHDQVAGLIREHRTTLVFVSTRRMAERVAHSLVERLGEAAVTAHHGSLSRRLRQQTEERLKQGQLQAVVATASLELGIDVGAVDLVCQIGTPRAISTLLQRVGRANHRPERDPDGAEAALLPPKGRLFALTRDELVECAALVRAARQGEFDRLRIPECPLDVLAQQLVAICASDEWEERALYELCQRAWPFRHLTQARFEEVVCMLADGVAARRGRLGAHLHRDQVGGRLRGRRGARLFALLNGGTIPEPNDYEVIAEPGEVKVGRLDEEWVAEASPGDIFLLGSTSWRLSGVRGGQVLVTDAGGAPPTVPFWAGEAPGRTFELSQAVSALRGEVAARLEALGSGPLLPSQLLPLSSGVAAECGISGGAAGQMVAYLALGRVALGAMPTQQTLVAERFFDEGGGMQLVLHMPLGARINRAFGLALRKRFCRSFNFELQAAATDDGVVLSLGETHSFPLESVWEFLNSRTVEHVLTQALLGAPLFGPHFRWAALCALSLPRRRTGKKVPPQILRMLSEDLLAAVFPHQAACPENLPGGDIEVPDHPLVSETVRECLRDVMDLAGLVRVLEQIESGQIQVKSCDTAEPSVLSHQLLNAAPYAFLDDTPLEERRARAVSLRRGLPTEIGAFAQGARLDPQAIAAVERQSWPLHGVRDADELHDALLNLHYLPLGRIPAAVPGGLDREARSAAVIDREARSAGVIDREARSAAVIDVRGDFAKLVAAGRAVVLERGELVAWVATERADLVRQVFTEAGGPQMRYVPEPLHIPWAYAGEEDARERACTEVLRGWMAATGPWTRDVLAAVLHMNEDWVEVALLRLESEGQVLRGHFRWNAEGPLEWCDRRLLARIHRLTLTQLRGEIEPVPPALLVQFLARWQHVAPGTQLHGMAGLQQVLHTLQGFEAPCGLWEEELLAARLRGYDPAWLDMLCLSGEVAWGRLRPTAGEVRRGPTRSAPITFWLRGQQTAVLAARRGDPAEAQEGLSAPAAAVLGLLTRRGALFLTEICAALGLQRPQTGDALGELVSRGLCTADGFAGLRALIGDLRVQPTGTGRWALLPPVSDPPDLNDVLGIGPDPGAVTIESWARQYLLRYGVVLRELLQRETGPAWREVLPVYRKLEARGEIRGGRFVVGVSGEQYALPEAIEALRAVRKNQRAEELLAVCAADPLNLLGVLFPGGRVPANAGARVQYRGGGPVVAEERTAAIAAL